MRNVLETLPQEWIPEPMATFPRGSCGDASLLLGSYLADCGYFGFEYIAGERGFQRNNTWTSHAWLAQKSIIVDITADQFSDAPSAVVICNSSIWHQQLEIITRSPSDFRLWTGQGTNHLHILYNKIKTLI